MKIKVKACVDEDNCDWYAELGTDAAKVDKCPECGKQLRDAEALRIPLSTIDDIIKPLTHK